MTDIRQTRRSLWLVAQGFINVLASIFGRSEEIAARHTILRPEWRLICQWLRAGEALMRMLLMIEAAALPKPNTRMPLLREKCTRAKRMMEFWPDKPDDWRVSFHAFISSPAHSGGSAERRSRKAKGQLAPSDAPNDLCGVSSPASGGDTRFKSAWPLAERAEALLRVFNDPLPYALRLARRLYAVPHRAPEVLRYTPDLPPLVGAVGFGSVCDAAHDALRVLDG